MKFKRCDRCGNEIKATGKAKVWEFITENITNITRAIAGEPTMAVYRDTEPADLCSDCKKSFDEWMKAGAKSQHQNEQEDQEPDRNIENEEIIVARIPKGPEPLKFGDF